MRINLLLFALYRDLTGIEELAVEITDGSSAAAALAELRAREPRLRNLPARPVIAINREYALLDAPLRDGDELALLPAVAGG
jgi:molybdopterin converting factor small subunit